jgi:integrase/recombinase XerC
MTDWIARYVRHLKESGRYARTTIADREELLRRFDHDLPFGLIEATTEELQDRLTRGRVDDDWSAQTIATYQGHLKGLFRWGTAGPDPNFADDPTAGLIRPKVPKTLPHPWTDEQLAVALERSSAQWRLIFTVAAYTGARCCELAELDREDITDTHLVLTGKGGKSRVVPTRPEVWAMVRQLPPGPIAAGPKKLQPTAAYISSMGKGHLHSIGLTKLSMHGARHWYATTLIASGANLRVVQELMGHESPETTAIYTLITSEQRRIAVAALPTLTPAAS